MLKKNCPQCNGNSYSAASRGSWECPYCSADLSAVEAQPAGIAGQPGVVPLTQRTVNRSLKDKINRDFRAKLVTPGMEKRQSQIKIIKEK